MGLQRQVGNERILQSTREVTVLLTETGTSVPYTKIVIENVTGTEREKRIRNGRTIEKEGDGNMKRTDTARDMEGRSMTEIEGNIATGTETVTIIVTVAADIETPDVIGKCTLSMLADVYKNCLQRPETGVCTWT